MRGRGVQGEEAGGDRGDGGGDAVHVIQQVDGVRHADEPENADRRREYGIVHRRDADAAREHDRHGSELCADLRDGAEAARVVDEAGDEDDRAAAEDAEQLGARRDGAGGNRRPDAGENAGEDSDASE